MLVKYLISLIWHLLYSILFNSFFFSDEMLLHITKIVAMISEL